MSEASYSIVERDAILGVTSVPSEILHTFQGNAESRDIAHGFMKAATRIVSELVVPEDGSKKPKTRNSRAYTTSYNVLLRRTSGQTKVNKEAVVVDHIRAVFPSDETTSPFGVFNMSYQRDPETAYTGGYNADNTHRLRMDFYRGHQILLPHISYTLDNTEAGAEHALTIHPSKTQLEPLRLGLSGLTAQEINDQTPVSLDEIVNTLRIIETASDRPLDEFRGANFQLSKDLPNFRGRDPHDKSPHGIGRFVAMVAIPEETA